MVQYGINSHMSFVDWKYICLFWHTTVEHLCELNTVAFTRLRFQHKNEHLVTVLAFCLHANDENAHVK